MGLIDAQWAINEVPVQLEIPAERSIPSTVNMQFTWNSYEYLWENSARNFRVQNECEWTSPRP